MTIEDQTASSPDQLYNYLLAHERRYEMRVLRMMPLFEDVGGQTVRPGGRSDGAGQGTADTGPGCCRPGLAMVGNNDLQSARHIETSWLL